MLKSFIISALRAFCWMAVGAFIGIAMCKFCPGVLTGGQVGLARILLAVGGASITAGLIIGGYPDE